MRKHLDDLVALGAFPLALLASTALATVLVAQGTSPATLPVPFTALALVLAVALERWFPRVGRPPERGERRADGLWFVLTAAVSSPLVDGGLAAVAASLAAWLPAGPLALLPTPLAVLVALVIAELGGYWAHRLAHEVPWLWRLHAVHHAPHRMTAVNNFRLHPLDIGLKQALGYFPVLLLGPTAETLALAGVVRGVVLAFQHVDADLRHGALSWVFATNTVHRWHHSSCPAEGNAHYGSVLVLWDQVFGTWRPQPDAAEPEQLGLFEEGGYPVHRVARALVAPVCWDRCVTPAAIKEDTCRRGSRGAPPPPSR